jgi:vanillate O-demethylase ferredoxin subunit
MTQMTVRVAHKRFETAQICSFELVPADDAPLPGFSAGAHIDVHTPNGPMRQYSLCNDPAERGRYVIGVLRDPASRGGSVALVDGIEAGHTLRISAPRNHFALVETARHTVLMGGGIGITPLLCMAERLAACGASFELHYAVRSRAAAAFLDRMAEARWADRTHLHCDDGPPAQRLDLAALVARPSAGTHLYVCGPSGYMDAVLGAARGAAWPEDHLHCEYFAPVEAPAGANRAFELHLARSGRVLTVPADRSVAEVLIAAGVDLEVSCEQGVCGACLTRVVEGVPEHRDMLLTAAERAANDQFTPCCSRALSPRLVVDL